jgi:choline dehydrogenase
VARVVVVGAGSSGATLAGRLVERGIEVALIDAGSAPRAVDVLDGMRSPNPNRALVDDFTWPDLVARRTAAQSPYRYWRGRGLGGTSAVNGQLAIRPGPEAFERWPPGWAWDDVLPWFVRLEDDVDFGDAPYHGRRGPIPIRRAPEHEWEPVDAALRDAAVAAGYATCADHNAPEGSGVSAFAANSRDGRRVSTADAYVEPVRDDPLLTIVPSTLVDRVQLDGGVARAVVTASGELIEGDVIVIAAGAIHSPAILQRSGIGPPAVLRRAGLDVVVDLPVGMTLMEHPIAYCVLRLEPDAWASSVDARYTNVTVRYSSELAGGVGNDLMLVGNNLVGSDDRGRGIGIVGVALEEARSTGRVAILTADPSVDPEVDIDMLSDVDDLVRLRDGARRVFELVRQPAIAKIAASITAGRATAIDDLADDDALDRWLLAEAIEGNHVAASCPMGPVLDASCRVHGVERLHVVDASSFPTITPANPHLTAVMLGEAMADLLAR